MNLNPYYLNKIDLIDDNFEPMVFKNQINDVSDFQLLNDNTIDDDIIMNNQEQIIESFDNLNNDDNDLDYVYENFNPNILNIVNAEDNNNEDDSDLDQEKEYFFGKSFTRKLRKFGRNTRKSFAKSKKKKI